MLDLYETLEVEKTASDDDIKKAFRRLARKYHPDVNEGKDNHFKIISEAYEILSDIKKRTQYDRGGLIKTFTITTKNHTYRLEELAKTGALSDIYKGTSESGNPIAFKVSRDTKDNDLLENEARVLAALFPPDKPEEGKRRYLPRFHESLRLAEEGKHRQVNILDWLSNFHTLHEVRKAFDRKLQMEHGIWIFNRILEGLDYIHNKGYIHGSLTPDHVVVFSSGEEKHPYNHGAKLIDWSYAVRIGEKVKAIDPAWEDFYPPEVLQKKATSKSTDIYMAVKCIIHVLGGDGRDDILPLHTPHYLSRFLKGCVLKNQNHRPTDAWELHKELSAHLRSNYGPKKYIRFDMPY